MASTEVLPSGHSGRRSLGKHSYLLICERWVTSTMKRERRRNSWYSVATVTPLSESPASVLCSVSSGCGEPLPVS